MSPILRRGMKIEKQLSPEFLLYTEAQKVVEDLVKELKKAYPKRVAITQTKSDKIWQLLIVEMIGSNSANNQVYEVTLSLTLSSQVTEEKSMGYMHCEIVRRGTGKGVQDTVAIGSKYSKDAIKKFKGMILAYTDKY
ncbi:hypothetical protein J4471_02895 [Candidatus Woesearchaeota archaeon]|nr:hypothetical protein [Candidatus Woesearchaeota archaeon]